MKRLNYAMLGAVALLPTSVFAALGDGKLGENDSSSLSQFLVSIQNWLLGLVGALSVLFIVYGGFLYITSAGNKDRIETAKRTLTYAIAGLIIVVLAGFILQIITGGFLTSIFGTGTL